MGSWLRGSPQLHSVEKHEPCWQEVWQGFLFFLSKERVRWRRLDTVEKSPGGREEEAIIHFYHVSGSVLGTFVNSPPYPFKKMYMGYLFLFL